MRSPANWRAASALLVIAIGMACSAPAHAAIIVQIVDAPTDVPRYSPVWLTVSVENTGTRDELIPTSEHGSGTRVAEIGTEPGHRVRWWDGFHIDCFNGCGAVALLPAGQSTLFRFDLTRALAEPGAYYVRIGLVSGSDCAHQPEHAAGGHCWVGNAFSTIVRIDVREPDSEIDRAAREFMQSPDFPVPGRRNSAFTDDMKLLMGAKALTSRFPQSHYTWAAVMRGRRGAPEEYAALAETQPAHPLAVYARLAAALAHIDRGEPQSVTPAMLDSLRLPPPLRAFAEQEREEVIAAQKAIRMVRDGARLRVAARRTKPLEGEGQDIRVSLENAGESEFAVASEIAGIQMEMLTPEGWTLCDADRDRRYVEPDWRGIEPGAVVARGGLYGSCAVAEGGTGPAGQRLQWNDVAGVYRIRARWAHRPLEHAIRRGYEPGLPVLDAELVSNEITIEVRRATGIDAEAIAWARAHDIPVYDSRVADAFPGSTYAADRVFLYLVTLNYEAARSAELMRRGQYLQRRDVTDERKPPGLRLTGADLARWRIEQAEAILARHPDFSGADELRLTIAVDRLALGEKTLAKRELRRLARVGPPLVSEWARQFLDVLRRGLRGRAAYEFVP